ncbi:rifin, partial [Plasmodium falciparum RAJ116]
VGSPHKNPSITPNFPPNTRLLCDCELYSPANYDDDPQMKKVMGNFNKQTQQRFHEYDNRMKTTRQKCKDKCDKEVQKIILKDKLEKQMEQQLTTLETKIDTDDIPTCICEKSLADKVEKNCLACGGMLSGGVAPTVGLIGSVAVHVWKPVALKEAINAALNAAANDISAAVKAAGIEAGKNAVIGGLDALKIGQLGIGSWEPYFTTGYNVNVKQLASVILNRRGEMCGVGAKTLDSATCKIININLRTIHPDGSNYLPDSQGIPETLELILDKATTNAEAAEAAKNSTLTAEITTEQTTLIEAGFENYISSINASIIAILIIVLIMRNIIKTKSGTNIKNTNVYIKISYKDKDSHIITFTK